MASDDLDPSSSAWAVAAKNFRRQRDVVLTWSSQFSRLEQAFMLPYSIPRFPSSLQLTAKPLNAIAVPLAVVEGCLFFCDWLPRHRQRGKSKIRASEI